MASTAFAVASMLTSKRSRGTTGTCRPESLEKVDRLEQPYPASPDGAQADGVVVPRRAELA
jgi:hypothetical protein